MAGSILLRDIVDLNSRLQENINYVDLNYSGPKVDKRTGKKSIKIEKATPILNAYKMWLQSGEHDYIRRPNYGGFFARNLNNYNFSPDSEKQIEEDLITLSHELFPDINIISCKVTCYLTLKKWGVKIIVADKNTGLVAADMVTDQGTIVFDVNNISVS